MRTPKSILGTLIALSLVWGAFPLSPALAQSPAGEGLRLLSSEAGAAVLELTVGDFETETLEHEGQTYLRPMIPGMTNIHTPGAPQVPTRSTLLGVTSTQGVSIEILDAEYETLPASYPLYPAPAWEIGADNPDQLRPEGVRQAFVLDHELYAADALYPGRPAEIGYTGIVRGQAVAQVDFYPLQYNPARSEMRLYRRILARVTWDPALTLGAAQVRAASPAFENLLGHSLLNYHTLERPPLADEPPAPLGGSGDIGPAGDGTRLKIGVTEDGLYQLNRDDLTGAEYELSGVALSQIKIKNQGVEVPIYVHDDNGNDVFDGDDFILFYGVGLDDVYTFTNVYWLEEGPGAGQRMGTRDGTPSGGTVPTAFPNQVHAEEDSYYWATMANGSGQDHWFWGEKLSAPQTRDHVVTLNHIASNSGVVRVRLKGYTTPSHRTRIYLNGSLIDDQTWSGQIGYNHEVAVSNLSEGSNTVRVEAVNEGLNQFFVNWIEIDYSDSYVAENDQLFFGPPTGGSYQFEVTGYGSDDVEVFDVTDPADVKQIINSVTAGGTLQFKDTAQSQTRYLALTPARRKSPASIHKDQSSSWKSTSKGADYIIITHQDFYDEALALASHRSSFSGLSVVTVKVEDVYDEFNHGIFNPEAIRDFLSYAYHNWNLAPTYVLLVGDATYDFKDNLGQGLANAVPTQLIETPSYGETASDNYFVAVDGTDALPDMFIGRLTVRSDYKADDVVDKIIHYDLNPPAAAWNTKVLLVADDGSWSDGYSDAFEITSEELADRLPFYYTASKVYARNYPPGNPTTDITNRINSGRLLVNYAGHGSVTGWGQWSGGFIFSTAAINDLNNTHKLPVVTVGDCLNGLFTGEGTSSMAERFLVKTDQGAVAVWAATGLGYASSHRAMLGSFYDAVFRDDVYALGAATTQAKLSNPGLTELIQTFVLFGDPAMELGLPTNYPYVESTTPADGALDVALDEDLKLIFSKPMNPATVVLSGPGAAGFSPSWNSDQTQVVYTHPDFNDGTNYTYSIAGQDQAGNDLGAGPVPNPWSFTTIVLAPSQVSISGPTTGITQTLYTFTASVSPGTAAQPITYKWTATGQSQVTHYDRGLSDQVSFTWSTTGTKTISVVASNSYGSASDSHQITIKDTLGGNVYLPIVVRHH